MSNRAELDVTIEKYVDTLRELIFIIRQRAERHDEQNAISTTIDECLQQWEESLRCFTSNLASNISNNTSSSSSSSSSSRSTSSHNNSSTTNTSK